MNFPYPDFGIPPIAPSDGTGQPSQLGDLLELRRYLGSIGMADPVQPNLIPTPGLHIGPVHLSGPGLDSAALSVLGMMQGMGQPRGFGQNFASGLAYGLASGRARQAQARGAANQAAVEDAAKRNQMRQSEISGFASKLAQWRHEQKAAAAPTSNDKTMVDVPGVGPVPATSQLARDYLEGSGKVQRPRAPKSDVSVMTDDQRRYWGHVLATGGKMPTFGRGDSPDRTAVLGYAADEVKAAGGDINANRALAQGLTSSYAQIRKNYDSVTAFENTALANAEQLKQALQGLADTGSPLLNTPVRNWDQNVLGKTNIVAFNTARRVVAPEFGRLLASASANGVLTDTAREEAMANLPAGATGAQILRALDILTTDAGNRKQSYADQLRTIEGGFRSINKPGGASVDTTQTPKRGSVSSKYK